MMAGPTHHALARPEFDEGPKILIVVAPYYKDIADNLVAGAMAEGVWSRARVLIQWDPPDLKNLLKT